MFLSLISRRLEGHPLRAGHKYDWGRGSSFYYTKLLYFPDELLQAIVLSQHPGLSSRTVRPRALCGALCMGHAVRTWSAVCSGAPFSQFSKGARPYLCHMDKETVKHQSAVNCVYFKVFGASPLKQT